MGNGKAGASAQLSIGVTRRLIPVRPPRRAADSAQYEGGYHGGLFPALLRGRQRWPGRWPW